MSEPRTIQVVVAFDFSPSSEHALQRAIDVVVRAPRHLLHVVTVGVNGRHVFGNPFGDAYESTADRLHRIVHDSASCSARSPRAWCAKRGAR